MTKKRNLLDNLEDIDETTYELLGSKLSKLASDGRTRERIRERRASDHADGFAPAPKTRRPRERERTQPKP